MSSESSKSRLDLLVVERGLAETRARAQAIILGGGITVNGAPVTKPGSIVEKDSALALLVAPLPYVSRGGLKLRHALDQFEVDVEDRVAIDVGASTGGFTDVLIQARAARVYAVDVGYGQMDWRLRNDPRVVVMERTNIRGLQTLPEQPSLATIDVAFISLALVFPVVRQLLTPDGQVIALVKPQFEAGRAQVGKGGVVRDPAVWRQVLFRVLDAAEAHGWATAGLIRSPIRGPAGNVEFLTHLVSPPASTPVDRNSLVKAVLTDDSQVTTSGHD